MANTKIRTIEERESAGKALREKCSRGSHATKILGQGAARDPVALIEASNKGRMPNLVPIRHGRMVQSPFAFFRGTAAIQAHDLYKTPSSGIVVQSCGDCHLMNFGGFASPERTLVFDINDFDETLPAPFEWDLKRLAASFVVAGRWRDFKESACRDLAVAAVAAYRESMKERSGSSVLDAWYSRITMDDVEDLVRDDPDLISRVRKRRDEAAEQTHERVAAKLTTSSVGGPKIVDEPPLLFHVPEIVTESVAKDFLRQYRATLPEERRVLFDRYQLVDVAVKVVGVGSVGTRCLVALLLAAPDDPLFLQIKEARPSVLEPYTSGRKVAHNGERVVIGQRLMQSSSDIFLGWASGRNERDFYVRQLRDMKVSAEVETMTPRVMRAYARLCGLALARAHDKAGDAAMISGYLGSSDKFDQAMGDYAVAYADQVEKDYKAFVAAVRKGRIKTDVSPGKLETALR